MSYQALFYQALGNLVGEAWTEEELHEVVSVAFSAMVEAVFRELFSVSHMRGRLYGPFVRLRKEFLSDEDLRQIVLEEERRFLRNLTAGGTITHTVWLDDINEYMGIGGALYESIPQMLVSRLEEKEARQYIDKAWSRGWSDGRAKGLFGSAHTVFYSVIFETLDARTRFRLVHVRERGWFANEVVPMTVTQLEREILPVLKAMTHLNDMALDLLNRRPYECRIASISQNSPISLNFDLPIVKEIREETHYLLEPWRRDYARHMAELEVAEKEEVVMRAKAEVVKVKAEAEAIVATSNKSDADADVARAAAVEGMARARVLEQDAEAKRLDNERKKVELLSYQVELVKNLVNMLAPNLTESERLVHVMQMLPAVQTLLQSNYQVEFMYLTRSEGQNVDRGRQM